MNQPYVRVFQSEEMVRNPGPRKVDEFVRENSENFNYWIQLSSVWDQHKDAVEVWPVSFIADKFNYELSCLWGTKKRIWIEMIKKS